MQDRFKFRYFNKLSNKMVEPKNWQNIDFIFECLKQQICYDNDISLLPYNHIGNGLVFMQCTGLKDKNGKLVFFDDLVKNKWGEICKVIMQTDEKNYGRVVLQNLKNINNKTNKDVVFIPNAITESELIGNIWVDMERYCKKNY